MYTSNQNSSSSSPSDHNNNKSNLPPISPRISFSNDFAESHRYHRHHKPPNPSSSAAAAAASSDFEFCVPTGNNSTMIGADELFFKGRLLPLKQGTTTLREELMVEEGNQSVIGRRLMSHMRPPLKGWKELLGLRKGGHNSNGSKKSSSAKNNDQELSG
ncbi:uncharacterized protein LOC124919977 [Impatiens glandulifera]|uniref:uncharacterized protein LOC124919977 n=1 Tax=Impatiens glandulifera TaxID=253017 RepID=UPI001FB077AE|nr:uncharacterized protein LOC124919977 [Impatiens glandulifera]